MNSESYNIILYIVQIISIYNAVMMGWSVRKIGVKKYELTKKTIRNENIILVDLVGKLINMV